MLKQYLWVGSGSESGTLKTRSWIGIRNKSFRIHNTANKLIILFKQFPSTVTNTMEKGNKSLLLNSKYFDGENLNKKIKKLSVLQMRMFCPIKQISCMNKNSLTPLLVFTIFGCLTLTSLVLLKSEQRVWRRADLVLRGMDFRPSSRRDTQPAHSLVQNTVH